MSSVYTMDQITQYLVGEFARIFPDHESHAPLVRAAIQARSKRVQTIFDFYDEHKEGVAGCSRNPEHLASLGEMCERSLRATIREEVGKTSQKSGFVLRSFLVLNRANLVGLNVTWKEVIDVLDDAFKQKAQGLVQKRTRIVGVLVSDLNNPFFADVVAGIQARAHAWIPRVDEHRGSHSAARR